MKMPDGLPGSRREWPGWGKREKTIVFISLIIIFALLFLVGKVRAYPDTESYLKMSPIREPGYALLLNGAVGIFGENAYFVLGIIQNGLAVSSVFLTACYIGDIYKKRYVLILAAVCLAIPYVATPLFASSGLILTNAILSEGIALPLYTFYFLLLLKAVWENNGRVRNLGVSLLLAFALSLVRGQMLVALIAWMVVSTVLWFKEGARRKAVFSLLLFIISMVLRLLLVNSYNLIVNGKFTGTTYGPVTVLSNVIYVAEERDGGNIRDEDLSRLFYQIYDIAEKGQMLYHSAPRGFTEEAAFYSRMHDEIKDMAIYPILQDYAENAEGIQDYMERLVRVDELAYAMAKGLMPECAGKWLSHYARNVLAGLIRTVAFLHPVFNALALTGYAALILAGVYCRWRNKGSRAVKMLLLTALLTAGNVAAVAMTIMCISRYMIYNMAFVYISALLMSAEIAGQKFKGC